MTKLKVLVGCEESQEVTKAFRAKGHEAYSCDILPCSGGHPEWHLQMDVNDAIDMKEWDFIGLHPDCRKLTCTSNRVYGIGKPKEHERNEALDWTVQLWKKAVNKCGMVYLENPVGVLNTHEEMPKPQIIQPYYFGDPFQKTTCLWLHGLLQLTHAPEDTLFYSKTHTDRGDFYNSPSGKTMPKWLAESPSTNSESNRTIRSKTFPGIAAAMADQWG